MSNLFASIVLIIWPFVAAQIAKKNGSDKAAILLFLLPYLLLPLKTVISIPALPPLDKITLPSFVAFFLLCMRKRGDMSLIPSSIFARRMLILMFIFPIFTILANGDRLEYGSRFFNGLRLYDALNIWIWNFAFYISPFIVGTLFLRTNESHRIVVRTIAVCGLLYSILVMFEIRMSPRLHSDIYGIFPHSWKQQARGDGFRAVVFLGHGLLIAVFMAMTSLCVAALWRAKEKISKYKAGIFVPYMIIVMVLSKSLGALLYVFALLPVVAYLSTKMQVRIATGIVIVFLAFPLVRASGLLPIDNMIGFFHSINEERAESLEFRFKNEDILLEKANQRALFGWGTWGRNRVFHPVTGRDLSVTDGEWIIIFGKFGWMGYLTIFILICWPIFLLKSASKRRKEEISPYTAVICLLLAINIVDIIPNSSLNYLTSLFSGAILGRAIHMNEVFKKQGKLAEAV